MSEEAIFTGKNRIFSDNDENNGYTATEELHFDDFEEVAKAVLRQRKISATVSNHLTPQFAEYDKQEQKTRDHLRKLAAQVNDSPKKENQTSNQPTNVLAGNQVAVDSDVLDSLVLGLAQLVDSQRRFADEFGLKQEQVFSSDIRDMQRRGSATVLNEWFKGKKNNASLKIERLFEDLSQHQIGLLASLDTIARRTIKYLGPELTKKCVHGWAKFGPMWPHYRKRNSKLSTDEHVRYKVIIAPGVAYGYAKAKHKISNKLKRFMKK